MIGQEMRGFTGSSVTFLLVRTLIFMDHTEDRRTPIGAIDSTLRKGLIFCASLTFLQNDCLLIMAFSFVVTSAYQWTVWCELGLGW
jgi:hypothetical protein